ncbi:unnamed protein product [Linum trigynum]|uniref:Uncharacterized protein n=1 Tax=Linum trigynum TaxID=586398 RepID=A0AAV2FRQ0_9ROSI
MGGGSDAVYPAMMTPKADRHRPNRHWETGQGFGFKDGGWSDEEEGWGFDNQAWQKPQHGSRRDPQQGGHGLGRYDGYNSVYEGDDELMFRAKPPTIEFPKFNVQEDARLWIYVAERWFKNHPT